MYNYIIYLQRILKFLNDSSNGVILFSLGNGISREILSKEKIDIFLDAFSKLSEYKFIWKFSDHKVVQKLPSNVIIDKWVPQNDILGNILLYSRNC